MNTYFVTSQEPQDTIEAMFRLAKFNPWTAISYARELKNKTFLKLTVTENTAELLKQAGFTVTEITRKGSTR